MIPRQFQIPKEKPELSLLLRELSSLASDWKHIGVQLKIPIGQLNTIKSDNDRAKDCLLEMLEVWLKMTAPPPSWELLVEALTVVDPQKADEIRTKYCATV